MKKLIIAFGLIFGALAAGARFASHDPGTNFGWTPPVPVEQREFLYGDPDESLKAQAPELFTPKETVE